MIIQPTHHLTAKDKRHTTKNTGPEELSGELIKNDWARLDFQVAEQVQTSSSGWMK